MNRWDAAVLRVASHYGSGLMPSFFAIFDRRRSLARRSGSVVLFVVLILLLVAGGGGLVWYYFRQDGSEAVERVLTAQVTRGPFEQIVLEQGVVESSSNVDIKCEVKSGASNTTEIIWVIDEGTQVKKGDKLVELKTSALERDLVQQQIVCNTSYAMMIQAENTLRAAEIARLEYLEGSFRQEEQTILSEIFVAEESVRRAQLAFQSTERLAARGIVTALQLEGDQFAVEKARNELEAAQTKLEVMRKYTRAKMLKQFDSDIATSQARWDSEKESHKLELEKLEEIKQQIAKCTIIAPEAGQVVYANTFSGFGGSSEFVVEQGALVRENQILIRLPDPNKMQVKATINESRISLVRAGMPVSIEFDAIRGRKLQGRVTRVNQYAEPTSWRSGNIKEYAAFIEIFDPPVEVRSGMNAEVRIFVERQDDALQIPVQALYETKGRFFCLLKDGDRWETREVQVGSSNDSFMTLKSGLAEGESVVLNPRAYAERLELPYIPDPVAPERRPDLAAPQGDLAGGSGDPGAGGLGRRGGPGAAGGATAGPGGERPGGRGPAGADSAAAGPGGGFDPARIFSTLDTDGDGVISAEELAKMPEEHRARMAANDLDGDGAVSREEFMKAIAARGGGNPGSRSEGNGS
jgi:HlyD family secretion protein